MKEEPEDLIDFTYAAAQLVADDLDEAARLVERVFSPPAPTSSDGALERLSQLATGMNARRTGLLADRVQQKRLDDAVERALVALPAERRLAVYRSFLGDSTGHSLSDTSEHTIFMYAVQRHVDAPKPDAISVSDVTEALRRAVSGAAADAPPELREAVASRLNAPFPDNAVRPATTSRRAGVRFTMAVSVIVLASFLGMWLGQPAPIPVTETVDGENLLVILDQRIRRGDQVAPIFSGGSTLQAENMMAERFSIDAAVPSFVGGSLQMLSSTEVGRIDIPVLVYEDADSNPVQVFVLSYNLLNANRRVLPFPADVLNQIAVPDGVDIHTSDTGNRIIWRHRDDIYIAYARGDALSLRPRFTY